MGDPLSYWHKGRLYKDSYPYTDELAKCMDEIGLLGDVVNLTKNARSNAEALTESYNFLRDYFLNSIGIDYLLLMSADIIIPSFLIEKLYQLNADIAIPLIPHRGLTPTVFYVYDFQNEKSPIYPYADPQFLLKQREPFIVDGGSTACMMIKKRVLETILFKNTASEGIDPAIWFSKEVTNQGFKIWCDPSLRVGHLDEDGRIYTAEGIVIVHL